MIVIYIIINFVNGKVYIGSTKNVINRFNTHKSQLNSGIHHNDHLQNAWNKYGADSFKFKTLMVCPEKERNHCEQMLIDFYNSQNRDFGYNIKDADGHSNSEESKLKMSAAKKGKNYGVIGENHPNYRHDLDDNDIFDLYVNQGNTEYEIAEKLNASQSAIHNRLQNMGVDTKKDYSNTVSNNYRHDLDNNEIFDLFVNKGLSSYKIAEILNTNSRTVLNRLQNMGVDTSKNTFGKNNPSYRHDLDDNDIFDLYVNYGKTISEIAKILNTNSSTIHNRLQNMSVDTTRDNSGENNPMWNKNHTPKTKKKISEVKKKKYARIIKDGFNNGKQSYALRFNGKKLKTSIYPDKLLDWFLENYSLEIIKIEKEGVLIHDVFNKFE